MSAKNSFDKNYKPKKILTSKTLNEIGAEVESAEYVDAYIKDGERFVPQINFTDPANFAKFGSAEEYYKQSFKRIWTSFPYDGSEYEKYAWFNSSSYLDNYIYENEYPRTTGYVIFSPENSTGWGTKVGSLLNSEGLSDDPEYIQIIGGPHKDPDQTETQKLFPSYIGKDGVRVSGSRGSNVHATSSLRESNLKIDFDLGTTVEFWMKKDDYVHSTNQTGKEIIFDLWNGVVGQGAEGHGRFRVYLDTTASAGGPLVVHYMSSSTAGGSKGRDIRFGTLDKSDIIDSNWHHIAVTMFNSSSTETVAELYIDGRFKEDKTFVDDSDQATVIRDGVDGALIANIGGSRTPNHGGNTTQGYGKLSASLDEFRFWKTRRSAQEIGRYWNRQVGGGSNVDDANTKLGVQR